MTPHPHHPSRARPGTARRTTRRGAAVMTDAYRGNWKRHICAWLGHDNIGVRNLLYGTPEVMCLRCRNSSRVVPEWSPFRNLHTPTRPAPTSTGAGTARDAGERAGGEGSDGR